MRPRKEVLWADTLDPKLLFARLEKMLLSESKVWTILQPSAYQTNLKIDSSVHK
jgi:hypothetical protein